MKRRASSRAKRSWLIHEHSRGIPRTINVICDNALVSGMALGKQPVGRDIVLEVCRDFDLWLPMGPRYQGTTSGDIDQESDSIIREAPSEDRSGSDEPAVEIQ